VVRRSLVGDARHVAIDGQVIVNLIAICHPHHEDVTEHRAWILFEEGRWAWYEVVRMANIEKLLLLADAATVAHPKSGRTFLRVGLVKEARWDPKSETTITVP